MTEMNQIQSDLGYVRDALRKSEKTSSPASIFLLWALISLVGFSLIDFNPRYVPFYWAIMSPVGLLLSVFLGRRYSIQQGQSRRSVGMRYSFHFMGMMAIIFLALPLGFTHAVAWDELSKVFLLIITLTYFLAGIHLERSILWVSLVTALGYLSLFFIHTYAWTMVGAMLAVALAATGLLGGRSHASATD